MPLALPPLASLSQCAAFHCEHSIHGRETEQHLPSEFLVIKSYVVNNIAMTMYGSSWVLEISGGTLCKVYDYLNTVLYT